MREAKLKTGVHCKGCQEQLHTPHMTTRPLHVHLPAPLTANRHRKKTPNAHKLVLGWGLTSHSATSQSSRPTSALDTLHYLRQASFVIVALVEVGNSCAVSVSCSGCGGEVPTSPAWESSASRARGQGIPIPWLWSQHQIVPELYFAYEEKTGLFGG